MSTFEKWTEKCRELPKVSVSVKAVLQWFHTPKCVQKQKREGRQSYSTVNRQSDSQRSGCIKSIQEEG